MSEPDAGSDALGAKATATRSPDGKHWILNGTKQFITNGSFADLLTVFAKVDKEHFTAFLVEKTFPGVKIGAEEKKLGIKGSSTAQILFEDARVPVENVLGIGPDLERIEQDEKNPDQGAKHQGADADRARGDRLHHV